MTKRVTNVAHSVKDRLLRISKDCGEDYQRILQRYVAERLLARLASSRHHGEFILKGALLFTVWDEGLHRATNDMDLLGAGTPDPDRLRGVFREVTSIVLPDDGLSFDSESLSAARIREEAVYDGIRVVMMAFLGATRIRLQVDIGYGDQVVPAPEHREFPSLLHDQGPRIRMYRPETSIAEKLHAMVTLGILNSRMKDYYDIWFMLEKFRFGGDVLMSAVEETFRRRKTPTPESLPAGLSEEFASDPQKRTQWQAFVRKGALVVSPPEFRLVVERIGVFIRPVIEGTVADERWNADSGWVPIEK